MLRRHHHRGFTLIELMVVITIIALLASAVLTALSFARARSRDTRRLEDVRTVMTAVELYHNDFHGYPTPSGCTGGTSCNLSSLESLLVPRYLEKMPVDPRGDGYNTYLYTSSTDGESYGILVRLEKWLSGGDSYCKRGVDMDPAWFSSAYPTCP